LRDSIDNIEETTLLRENIQKLGADIINYNEIIKSKDLIIEKNDKYQKKYEENQKQIDLFKAKVKLQDNTIEKSKQEIKKLKQKEEKRVRSEADGLLKQMSTVSSGGAWQQIRKLEESLITEQMKNNNLIERLMMLESGEKIDYVNNFAQTNDSLTIFKSTFDINNVDKEFKDMKLELEDSKTLI